MSAVILRHPMLDRLQRDMARVFDTPAPVADFREARVKREREASERRYAALHGGDFDPRPAA